MFKRLSIRAVVAAVAATLIVAAASPVAAQQIRSPYDFVDRGQSLHVFATHVSTDRGTIGIGPHSAPALGVGYGIRVTGPFTFDSRIALMPTSRTVFSVDPGADPDLVREDPMVGLVDEGEADLTLLMADLSLRFDLTGPRTWNRLQPYALLGAGAIFRMAAEHAAEEEAEIGPDLRVRFRNGVTGHVGGGVEWHLADRFSVRFDARGMFWRLHVPTGFISAARVIDDRQWVQSGHLSVGGAFRF